MTKLADMTPDQLVDLSFTLDPHRVGFGNLLYTLVQRATEEAREGMVSKEAYLEATRRVSTYRNLLEPL